MTRAPQVAQAVSAMPKAGATPSSLPEPTAMTFVIYEDNGGRYHWTLVADGGEIIVRSRGFQSYEQAEDAARIVHRGASRASFEDRTGAPSQVDDLLVRRHSPTARDRLDAERWLDEGGSFSADAVTR